MRYPVLATVVLALVCPSTLEAEEFDAGSLIIPMDLDYQDDGIFKAFGLVYQLLLADVPVHWAIREGKDFGDADFTTDAFDIETEAPIEGHGYRAGPFVIDASATDAAISVIEAWQDEHVTVVHQATEGFETDVAQTLVAAPTIAMFADGNEDIARRYLLAAGIPDSTGDLEWPDESPDMLSPDEVAGPTTTNHRDGALFDDAGVATYCQLMSMHWGVRNAEDNPQVVAEVRQFLRYPTHFFAECQAVNAFENNVHGGFLTPFGFEIDNMREGDPVDFFNPDSPFAQIDGVYEIVRGSERSYTPCGDPECSEPGPYLAGGVVMITEQGTGEGIRDVWMTGFLDGSCPPDSKDCPDGGDLLGKVSYLGGHEYSTELPLSENSTSGGTRLFLQSLFEAPCATLEGQPIIEIEKTGAALTIDGTITYTLAFESSGGSVAHTVTIADELPEGATFVSATHDGVEADGVVTWPLGNLAPGATGSVEFTVTVEPRGATFENIAEATWHAGVNERRALSNTTTTLYDDDRDNDGVGDSIDNCPDHANSTQDLATDPDNCGSCGIACPSGACFAGVCADSGDDAGAEDTGGDAGGDADDDTGSEPDIGDDSEDTPHREDAGETGETGDALDESGGEGDGSDSAGVDADPEDTEDSDPADESGGQGTAESGCRCNASAATGGGEAAVFGFLVAGVMGRRRR